MGKSRQQVGEQPPATRPANLAPGQNAPATPAPGAVPPGASPPAPATAVEPAQAPTSATSGSAVQPGPVGSPAPGPAHGPAQPGPGQGPEPGSEGGAGGRQSRAPDADKDGGAADREEASGRRWPAGPDPTLDPCPKGNKSAAELWRSRKAILDLEAQIARLDATRTLKIKGERTAFETWQRRERLTAEQEGVRAMRSEGVDADAIKQMAELAKAAGMTVPAYVAHLAKGGS